MNIIKKYFKKKKEREERLITSLENIEKSLNYITKCIDTVDRYGSAIKTTSATRY